MNTDIIGDVHGYMHLLEKLLIKLDYEKVEGVYMHPVQKTVFVGDLINRGPEVKKVLETVHAMCEKDQARCVLGNHEINLIAYQLNKKKSFLSIEQIVRIEKQLESTLKCFSNDKSKLNFYTDWLRTLPAYIEEKTFRVVHACWLQNGIEAISKESTNNLLSDELIISLMNIKTKEYGLIHSLFQGVDIPLFESENDSNSKPVRIRWWKNMDGKSYRDMATKERQYIPDVKIPKSVLTRAYEYDKDDPILFLGHFCLDELPHIDSRNVCCLDFCVSKKGVLSAYRFLAENKLKKEHLYYVHN